MNLDVLIDELLDDPLKYNTKDEIDQIIQSGISYSHLREMVKRIYDINEEQLKQTSNANTGKLGKLNKKSTSKRYKKFSNKVDHQLKSGKYYRIYAEGDSWFQFPVFVNDIIDWLNKNEDFLIYSEAYGGDWITNILYEQQYIPALSTYSPQIFLISGGGNDLVGSHRLAIMVDKNSNYRSKYSGTNEILSNSNYVFRDGDKDKILNSQSFLNKEFYAILLVFRLQYTLLFNDIYHPENKHNKVISITQGYDFPIPSPLRRWSLRYPLQHYINKKLDSGNWLYTPLMLKGIINKTDQESILLTMIYEFNEMMSNFANYYEKVYHVDNRGITESIEDWYDELHLKSHFFKSVADAYEKIIREHEKLNTKIIRSKMLIKR